MKSNDNRKCDGGGRCAAGERRGKMLGVVCLQVCSALSRYSRCRPKSLQIEISPGVLRAWLTTNPGDGSHFTRCNPETRARGFFSRAPSRESSTFLSFLASVSREGRFANSNHFDRASSALISTNMTVENSSFNLK